MSQRVSGYTRIKRDLYETPEWVTRALLPHIPERVTSILEPAAGSGKMACALADAGYIVETNDISDGVDFLQYPKSVNRQAIVTNPPYALAQEFIEHAIAVSYPTGFVAMLLRTDFDHAKTRERLFAKSPRFAKKVVLTKRIKWFEDSTGSPSFNHAWYLWDWQHTGPPTIAYGPSSDLLL